MDPRILVTPESPLVVRVAKELGTPQNIFEFVRNNIRYVPDPNEVWRTATRTLELGYGDCDDHAILLCALLRTIHEPAKVEIIYFEGKGGHAFVIWNGKFLDTTTDQRFDQNIEYVFDKEIIEVARFDELEFEVLEPNLWGKISVATVGLTDICPSYPYEFVDPCSTSSATVASRVLQDHQNVLVLGASKHYETLPITKKHCQTLPNTGVTLGQSNRSILSTPLQYIAAAAADHIHNHIHNQSYDMICNMSHYMTYREGINLQRRVSNKSVR